MKTPIERAVDHAYLTGAGVTAAVPLIYIHTDSAIATVVAAVAVAILAGILMARIGDRAEREQREREMLP